MATITAPPTADDAGSPFDDPGLQESDLDAAPPATRLPASPFATAAVASIGAGAIHAAAIGVHLEHRQAAITFAVLGAAQIGAGALALVSRRRLAGLLLALVSLGALGGWVMAKVSGIGFIDGLGEVESIQWPDFLAASLAAVAFVVALRAVLLGRFAALPGRGHRVVRSTATVALSVAAVAGMTTVSGHSHAGTEGHSHGGSASTAATGSAGHSHRGGVATKAFDPDEPIDLSGVAGVTPKQQARAENLVAITLARLPQFADYRDAEAAGYLSIHDGFLGYEHFVNWDSINDDHILDPDHPESLVYKTDSGERELVSAMFMLPVGRTLDDVPDLGGALTQWHIHDNLCFGGPKDAPSVAGLVDSDGQCHGSLRKLTPVPMIHVWIVPHRCGPFAALEGVAGGQVKEGEEQACDHAHGSAGT